MGMTKGEIIGACGITLFFIIFLFGGMYLSDKLQEKYHKFYSKWCPKLNASVIEPIDGYMWQRSCFREDGNIITRYVIIEINGEYKLREIS